MAQAVSRRPLTTEARFRAWVSLCGISGGQRGIGTGFLRVVPFSNANIIPPGLCMIVSSGE
jgi:hypothetical protein